jgi:hypothetical protein
MAKLFDKETGQSLEVLFRQVGDSAVFYDFYLRWRGKPLLNPKIFKSGWADQQHIGLLAADDLQGECLLPAIRKALDTNMPENWYPTEPDVSITIFPPAWQALDMSTLRLVAFGTKAQQAHQLRQLRAEVKRPKKPLDQFEVWVEVDAHVLEQKGEILGPGVAVCITATRETLEKFYRKLRKEYVAACKRFCVEPKEG